MLETALESHVETPEKLRQAARAGDLAALAFLTHSLKGLTGNLSAPALYALSREAEDTVRAAGKETGRKP